MNYFSAYIYSIIGIKVIFILLALTHIYLKLKGEKIEFGDLDH